MTAILTTFDDSVPGWFTVAVDPSSVANGIMQFCIREGYYDYLGNAPSLAENRLSSGDYSLGADSPYLEVTYGISPLIVGSPLCGKAYSVSRRLL